MSSCETCWGDAYAMARMRGGHQVDHYYRLLKERPEHAAAQSESAPTPESKDAADE